MEQALPGKDREQAVVREAAEDRVAVVDAWAAKARDRAGIVYAPSATLDSRINRVYSVHP
jgi:hypothetical protein